MDRRNNENFFNQPRQRTYRFPHHQKLTDMSLKPNMRTKQTFVSIRLNLQSNILSLFSQRLKGLIGKKLTFKGCDRELTRVGFRDFLVMEKGVVVRNIFRPIWKRDLLGVKVPHFFNNCENFQEDKTCQFCDSGFKINCFDCELVKTCDNCLERITQINLTSTETNNLKKQIPNENGYMLPYYVGEDSVEEEREQFQGSHGKCNKCFVEMNHDNYIRNRNTCRGCYNQNRRK